MISLFRRHSVHRTKVSRLPLTAILLVGCSLPGLCQVPELFEDKILLNNIASPWGFTFISDDEVLLTEKQGKLFRYVISTNVRTEVTGLPSVRVVDQGGLLDVAVHPNFAENNYVYLTYTVAASGGQTTAMGRGTLVGSQLQNFTELFRALPVRNTGNHFGSRLVFDRENYLFMSVGDRGDPNQAQNTNSHLGKVLRFHDDGTIPASNPFVGIPNTKPEIYSWGHRNIQGMAMNPATGDIYANEHGPRGGDELNLIKSNTNYGWPAVTFGVNYNGSTISSDTTRPGMELPLTYWVPSIAPSGMTFIWSGEQNDQADVLIGALAGTHIHWLRMSDNKRVSSTRSMNGYARFRDVRQAPDGKLYALTETPNRFVLLRSSVPILNVDVKSLTVDSKSSTRSLRVFSNRQWSVDVDVPWCSVDTYQGQNNDSIRVSIEESDVVEERVATIQIRSLGLQTQTVVIRQESAPARLKTDTNEIVFGYGDSSAVVLVRSNVSWSVASSARWIGVSPVSGLGDQNVTIRAEENDSIVERVDTVLISAAQLPTQRVVIRQAAAPPILSTDKNEINLESGDTSISVQVRSNVQWSASSDADWIACSPLIGQSNASVFVSVDENTSPEPRIGNIIVRGSSVADATIRVYQEGRIFSSVSDERMNRVEYRVFPNPSDNLINVQTDGPGSETYDVTILNLAGRVIATPSWKVFKAGIDVSSLPAGVYFLHMTDGQGKTVTTTKFMKK